MKIQIMENGLANQIRYYVFVRFAERYHPGEKWFFDDSWFYVFDETCARYSLQRTYQLEKVFGLKLNLFSRYFDADTWSDMVRKRKNGTSMPEILLDMGLPVAMFEGRLLNVENPTVMFGGYDVGQASFSGTTVKPEADHLGFDLGYLDLPYENIYYHADWASKKWFSAYEKENLEELVFPGLSTSTNQEYADLIQSGFSVGIHVRRGDFLMYDLNVPQESFLNACKKVLDAHSNARFFVFSDDLPWCMEYAEELGFNLAAHTTYISGNDGMNSYIDMQLLSMCQGIIRNGESSFSQVAGWFNPNLEFDIKLRPQGSVLKFKD